MSFSNIEAPIFILAIIANIFLLFTVVRYAPKDESRRVFALFIFAQILWVTANYALFSSGERYFLFFLRLTTFFATIHAFAFFVFIYSFQTKEAIYKKWIFYILGVLLLVVLGLSFSSYIFSGVAEKNGELLPVNGAAIPLFGGFTLLSISCGVYYMIKKYLKSNGIDRLQWKYLIFGVSWTFALIFAFSLFNLVIFGNINTVSYGHLYTLPFVVFTTYAVVKHHLFRVRVVATELFAAIILLILLLDVFLSQSWPEYLLKSLVLIIVLVFSVILIRGTLREIKELERLSRAKSEFVSIASHQLRTPLTAIKGFLSLVQENSGDEQTRREWVDKAYQSNERLIRLVNDLLDISRIERGSIVYDFKKINVVSLIDSLAEELKIPAQNKNISLKVEKPNGVTIPEVKMDEEKIRQVILNLADNAINYTKEGGVTIKLIYLNSLNRLQILVKDTGVGMSKEDISNLFNIFSRGDNVKKTHVEGMGLGLYVAHKIVQGHGGKIWATSEGLHKGSTFYIELPIE